MRSAILLRTTDCGHLLFPVLHNLIFAVRDDADRRRPRLRFPREITQHGRQGDEEHAPALRYSQIYPGCLGHHAIDSE